MTDSTSARDVARRRASTAAATRAVQATDRARTALERLGSSLDEVVTALRTARSVEAHLALGYDSWDAYCAAEFANVRTMRIAIPDRVEIVAALTAAGMNPGDVGSALGISASTVGRDVERGQGTGKHDTGAAMPAQGRGARYTDSGSRAGQVIRGEIVDEGRGSAASTAASTAPRKQTLPWPGQHFAMHHELNKTAIARCTDRGHGNPSAYGACGPCWEQTIRADERRPR